MKKVFFSGLAFFTMTTMTNAAEIKSEVKKSENLNQAMGDCYYFIGVFDMDGNYIGKFRSATVHTNTALDCFDYVQMILGDMKEDYPNHTFRVDSTFS